MTDLIDRIDELVNEQLAAGEPENGFDYGDPDYPRCPHCSRHWHGLPITARIAAMYAMRRYDPEYTYAEDDSPVLCEGSEFIGPQRPPRPAALVSIGVILVRVLPELDEFAAAMIRLREHFDFESAMRQMVSAFDHNTMYVLGHGLPQSEPDGEDTCKPQPAADVDITFGPQNWIHEIRRIPPERQFPRPWPRFFSPVEIAVRDHWHQFSAPSFPVPEAPGYDFTAFNHDAVPPPWAPPVTAPTAHHRAGPASAPGRRRRGRSRQ